jgi:hypothetical protein
MRKGKDPEPDPYLRQLDPDPEGPKTCGPADPDPQHWFKAFYDAQQYSGSGTITRNEN